MSKAVVFFAVVGHVRDIIGNLLVLEKLGIADPRSSLRSRWCRRSRCIERVIPYYSGASVSPS